MLHICSFHHTYIQYVHDFHLELGVYIITYFNCNVNRNVPGYKIIYKEMNVHLLKYYKLYQDY